MLPFWRRQSESSGRVRVCNPVPNLSAMASFGLIEVPPNQNRDVAFSHFEPFTNGRQREPLAPQALHGAYVVHGEAPKMTRRSACVLQSLPGRPIHAVVVMGADGYVFPSVVSRVAIEVADNEPQGFHAKLLVGLQPRNANRLSVAPAGAHFYRHTAIAAVYGGLQFLTRQPYNVPIGLYPHAAVLRRYDSPHAVVHAETLPKVQVKQDSGRQDLNLRPRGPRPRALPD